MKKALAHDVSSQVQNRLNAPVPSGVTPPLHEEQSTLALGGPRLCTHTRHRASHWLGLRHSRRTCCSLGPGPRLPPEAKAHEKDGTQAASQEPPGARSSWRAVSLWGRGWAQSSSQEGLGQPQPLCPPGSPPPPAAAHLLAERTVRWNHALHRAGGQACFC